MLDQPTDQLEDLYDVVEETKGTLEEFKSDVVPATPSQPAGCYLSPRVRAESGLTDPFDGCAFWSGPLGLLGLAWPSSESVRKELRLPPSWARPGKPSARSPRHE